jgi:Holliday junction resolvase RusA-like endonuclease
VKAEIIRLILPGTRVPSANRLLRMHWTARTRLQKAISKDVMAALAGWRAVNDLEIPRARAQAQFVVFKKRGVGRTDQDNLAAGLKLIIDGLKQNGLIVDDSPAWFMFTAMERRASKEPRVEIAIIYGKRRA